MSLEVLIYVLEKAAGPDRELDAEIYKITTKEPTAEQHIAAFKLGLGREPTDALKRVIRSREAWALRNPRCYTQCIDAAVSLVPKGYDWEAGTDGARNWANVYAPEPSLLQWDCHNAKTPALAICVAALRSREISLGS